MALTVGKLLDFDSEFFLPVISEVGYDAIQTELNSEEKYLIIYKENGEYKVGTHSLQTLNLALKNRITNYDIRILKFIDLHKKQEVDWDVKLLLKD